MHQPTVGIAPIDNPYHIEANFTGDGSVGSAMDGVDEGGNLIFEGSIKVMNRVGGPHALGI
ncbi:hypothetical protein JH26_05180 [Microvirga sp. BSC39]|nr:hypothetical protein JH26_05180 [Microvirga sp. BSC39]